MVACVKATQGLGFKAPLWVGAMPEAPAPFYVSPHGEVGLEWASTVRRPPPRGDVWVGLGPDPPGGIPGPEARILVSEFFFGGEIPSDGRIFGVA